MRATADLAPGAVGARECGPRGLQRIVDRRRAALAKRLEPVVVFVIYGVDSKPPAYQVEAVARMLLTIGEEIGRLALTEPDSFTPNRLLRSTWCLLEVIIAAPAPMHRRQGP